MEKTSAQTDPVCAHGIPTHWHCGLCAAEEAPKCKHGNPFYCGLCYKETGDGRISNQTREAS